MKWLNVGTLLLVIIGGLNWGFVALGGYEFDLVAGIAGGSDTAFARLIYGLVGLSALWQLMPWFRALSVGEIDAEARPSMAGPRR